MAFTLTIAGIDFKGYVASDGYSWERNDVDAPNSGRDLSGAMRRRIVARKDKLEIACRPLSSAELTTLMNALTSSTVSVTYTVPAEANARTATFYNSKKAAGITQYVGNATVYTGVKFDLIEV